MSQSPGHQKHPERKVKETPIKDHMRVEIGGEVIADSRNVVRVDEDGCPARYYFPRADVKMDKLQPSQTRTHCPFKGDASYFGLSVGGKSLADAVWSYEDPYDEHLGLAGLLAFYDDKYRDIHVQAAP